MAQDSWPSPAHNSRAVTDTEYEKIAARFSDDGVWGEPADTAVCSAGTGLSVNVRLGVYGSVRGHAWTSGTSTVALTIAANASGSTRTDRIVLRLDRSAWTVRAVVVQGTPGAGAPALTQQTGDTGTYEVPLATVSVPNGASSVTVTRTEQYIGSRIRPCTSTTRPVNPQRGDVVFETNTGRWVGWDGSTWGALYESSGVVGVSSSVAGWAVSVEPVVEAINGTVHLRLGSFERTGAAIGRATDSRLPVSIPAAYRPPSRNQYVMAYITGGGLARITIYADNDTTGRTGQCWLTQKDDIANGDFVQPASVSWAVG